jgi:hypothetical protein
MTLPSIVPTGYSGTAADARLAKRDNGGAVRNVSGAVSVPSGTIATAIVGLVPVQKGARFIVHDKSFHCGNFGAASTTASFGIVYNDATSDDPDAFAAASTAPQAGGFVTLTNVVGLDLVAAADGWIAATVNTADADATADITFNVGVAYDPDIV